jgi:hypothetical protein
MNPTLVGTIVFTCTFAGALFGMWLRATLPEHQLDADARDTVKVGIGLIATMTMTAADRARVARRRSP